MDRETRIWESIVAVLVMALSVGAWVVSAGFPKGDNAVYGPALFPRVLGAILFAACAMVLVQSWRTSESALTSSSAGQAFSWNKLGRVLGLLVAMALCPLLLGPLGLLATTVLLTVGVCFLLGAKWHEALIAGVVMLVFVYLVFVLLLKVQT